MALQADLTKKGGIIDLGTKEMKKSEKPCFRLVYVAQRYVLTCFKGFT